VIQNRSSVSALLHRTGLTLRPRDIRKLQQQAFRYPSPACIVRAPPVAGFAALDALNAAPGKEGAAHHHAIRGKKQ
jgi:hypothetical protein